VRAFTRNWTRSRRSLRDFVAGAIFTAALAVGSNAAAQCADSTDCRAGRVCNKGRCLEVSCTKDADCPGVAICESKVCRPPPTESAAPPAPSAPAAALVVRPEPAPPPPPPAFRTERRRIPALYITGPAALGAAWLITIGVTVAVSSPKDVGQATSYAAIPVFGPWVMMASNLKTSDYTGPLVFSGVIQAAALGVTIAGIAVRRDVRVATTAAQSGLQASLVPTLGGAALVGTF
jgi:hypothetical protein